MRRKILSTLISLIVVAMTDSFCSGECPSADVTGDCFVDYEDFAVMAGQWLSGDPCFPADMAVIAGGTFEMGDSFSEGESAELPIHTVRLDSFAMGKYEVTNQQYCEYLNSALAQGLITVPSAVVYKAGSGTSYPYCDASTSSSPPVCGAPSTREGDAGRADGRRRRGCGRAGFRWPRRVRSRHVPRTRAHRSPDGCPTGEGRRTSSSARS